MKVWVVYGEDSYWNEEAVWGIYANYEDAKEKMMNVKERGHFAKVEEWEVKGE